MSNFGWSELEKNGNVPELHSVPNSLMVSINEVLNNKENTDYLLAVRRDKVITCENAQWVGSSVPMEEGQSMSADIKVFSYDGEFVYVYATRRSFIQKRISEEGLQTKKDFSVFRSIKNIKDPIEEENTMNKSLSQEDMEKLMQEAEEGAAAGGQDLTPSANFEGAQAGNTPAAGADGGKKEKEDRYLPKLAEAINKTKIAKPTTVHTYNHGTALLHGYFVNEAAKLQFSLSKQFVKEDGKNVLRQGVSDEVRRQFLAGGTVNKEDYQYEYAYRVTQSRPGPIIAAILTINKAGILDAVKLRSSGEILVPDTARFGEEKITQVIRKDTFPAFLAINFGDQGIKEDPATHGEFATKVVVETTRSRKVPDGATSPRDYLNQQAKNKDRSSLILPTNHLPRKVHETLEFNPNMSDEALDLLNRSTFKNLYGSEIKVKDQPSTLKRNKLRPTQQDYVTMEGDRIVSRYFTKATDRRLAIEIKPYYAARGSEEFLNILKFPVRHEVPNKNNPEKEPRWLLKSYDILNKDDIQGDNREKTSLYNGEYDQFISVVDPLLNGNILEEFAKVARKPRQGADNPSKVSAEDVIKILVMSNNDASSDALVALNGRKASEESQILEELYALTTSI